MYFLSKTELDVLRLFYPNVFAQGKRNEAISFLRKLGKDMYLPGIVSALITLYQADGEKDQAAKLIREAIDYYRQHPVRQRFQ